MAVTPDTIIHLLKVPIEIDNLNQLTFATSTAQYNYFISLPKLTEEDLSYQRKDNYILFPAHIDTIIEYNYCMYQNTNYTNKWFYAFITRMEYENDGLTRIYIETDCFQTWQFDLTYKACFVEREHVNDDTIGKHTIDENLNVGEIMQESVDDILMGTPDPLIPDEDLYYYAVNCTFDPIGHEDFTGTRKINGNLFGHWIYIFNSTSYLRLFFDDLATQSKLESILDLYILPKNLVDLNGKTQHHREMGLYEYYMWTLNETNEAKSEEKTINKTTSFTGVTIKNNKSYCYPYNYLLVTNNIGNNIIYKYEDFSTSSIKFDVEMATSIGASVRLVPKDYKNVTKNYDESLQLAKYPTASWSSDAFTNWLTAEAVNIPTSLINIGANIATGSVSGSVGSVGALIGQFYKASLLPSITGGNNTGDVNFSAKCNKFTLRHMRAKNEYISQIDSYFSMYGYKVNEVKVPNITGRTYWNFVKTINCNIEGAIPQDDLQKIKGMFDKGITLWHDPTKFLDYTQNNSIVTP